MAATYQSLSLNLTAPTSSMTSTSTPVAHNATRKATGEDQYSVSNAELAGISVAALFVGLLLGAMIGSLLLRRQKRRLSYAHQSQLESQALSAQIAQNAIMALNEKQLASSSVPKLMYASPHAYSQELTVALSRIQDLENERNAASAFGDQLDRHAEMDLIESAHFGIGVINHLIDQMSMAICTSATKQSVRGNFPEDERKRQDSHSLSNSYTTVVFSKGQQWACTSAEATLRHVINMHLFEDVFTAFCFAAPQGLNTAAHEIEKLVCMQNDQSMAARWCALTHSGLRQQNSSSHTQRSIDQVLQSTMDDLCNVLLWTEAEVTIAAARKTISKVDSRLRKIISMSIRLATVLREEVSSASYDITIARAPQTGAGDAVTLSLGLASRRGQDQRHKVLLQALGQ